MEVACCVRLHTLLYVVECCWDRTCCPKSKASQNFSPCKQTQHCELLCLFSPGSKCQLCCFRGIHGYVQENSACLKAQSESYHESDSFSIDFDTILYYKLFGFFFLPFFYSSAFSVFDIKIKIECKGDQYIIL